jgi:hypothetical protein
MTKMCGGWGSLCAILFCVCKFKKLMFQWFLVSIMNSVAYNSKP